MVSTLVTGGVRSGKSSYAEGLFSAERALTYLATGYPVDPVADPSWAERVALHQRHRPTLWRTVETLAVADAIAAADTPVLLDCLGVWVTRSIDQLNGWERPASDWEPSLLKQLDDLAAAITAHRHDIVIVTNEVGWGVVPPTASGRLFADTLGRANQRLAQACDRVVLLVAGRPLVL